MVIHSQNILLFYTYRKMSEDDNIMTIATLSDEDKEKMKAWKKEKLVDWIYTQKGIYDQSESEKDDLETKLGDLTDTLTVTQSKLEEEEEYNANLTKRLDAAHSLNISTTDSTILFVSDGYGSEVFSELKTDGATWLYKEIDMLSSLLDTLKDPGARKDFMYDKIVVMLGREDIVNGADTYKLLSKFSEIVKIFEEMCIPVVFTHILPIKARDHKCEVKLLNGKLSDHAKKWDVICHYNEVFKGLMHDDIFVKNKITVRPTYIKEVAKEIVSAVGVPEKLTKSSDPSSDDDNITEFVQCSAVEKGAIIGGGSVVQSVQNDTHTVISCISYKFKDAWKHGALISGNRTDILSAKIKIADICADLDSNPQRSTRNGGKRNQSYPKGTGNKFQKTK